MDPCSDACCLTGSITLNTGHNYQTGTLYPAGADDPFWQVIADDNKNNGPTPRAARVHDAAKPTWGDPLDGSQWVGGAPSAWNDFIGTTLFEKLFCVCGTDSTDLLFDLRILADDSASIYVDGVFAGSAARPASQVPTTIRFTRRVAGGYHAIVVALHNAPGLHSGFNLQGTVSGPRLINMLCCGVADMPAFSSLATSCDTSRLTLGTDTSWAMIMGTGPAASRRCGTIVTSRNPGWGKPIEGSQWIGPDLGGSSTGTTDYIYRKCFCVRCTGAYSLSIEAMTDDDSEILLDGKELFTIGTRGFISPTSHLVTVTLDSGCHCIEVRVHDYGSVVTGADLLVDIQGSGLIKDGCCPCSHCGAEIADVDDDRAAEAALALQCVPNPLTHQATIRFMLPRRSHIRLELYASDGTLARVLDDGDAPEGGYVMTFDREGIPSGAYRLRLQFDGRSYSIPVVME